MRGDAHSSSAQRPVANHEAPSVACYDAPCRPLTSLGQFPSSRHWSSVVELTPFNTG
jgi:hypothetical protein